MIPPSPPPPEAHQSAVCHKRTCSTMLTSHSYWMTGAVTSVTNFATSVSRNMERLSLDTEHRERQEEWRRHKPQGLSDGIRQGLTGFGLSILGECSLPVSLCENLSQKKILGDLSNVTKALKTRLLFFYGQSTSFLVRKAVAVRKQLATLEQNQTVQLNTSRCCALFRAHSW